MKYIDGISIEVNQLDIKLIETISIPSGCVDKVRVKFKISGPSWNEIFPKIAVFRAINTTGRDVTGSSAIINGYAVIPAEIISEPHNIISAGVKMIDDEGGQISTKMIPIGKTDVGAAGSGENVADPLGEFLTEFAKISSQHFDTATQKLKDYADEIIPSFEDWFHFNAQHDIQGVVVKRYEDLYHYYVFDKSGELIETIDLLENAEHGERATVEYPTILVTDCPANERPQIFIERDSVYEYLELCKELELPEGLEDGHEYTLEFETLDRTVITMKICQSETEPWHIEVYESDCGSKSYYFWEDRMVKDGIVQFSVRAGVWFESIDSNPEGERIVCEDGTVLYRSKDKGISLSRTLKNVKCVNADGAEKFKDMFTVRPYAIVKDCGFYVFDANEGKWVWELDGYKTYQIKIPAERWGWGNRFTLVLCGMKPEEELKVSVKSGDCEGLRIANPRTENLITLECDVLPQGDIVINLDRSARDKKGSIG